jgi:biopolymer transport protein ExbD
MGMSVGGKGGAQADINVTPLVDIVLVLLIIFMVITPMLSRHLPIEVPQKAETEQPQDSKLQDQMVLMLFADGHVELNKQPITSDTDLTTQLTEAFKERTKAADSVLFFDAEDDAPYGRALTLMDLAKGAGIQTVGVMTPKEEPEGVEGAEGAEGAEGDSPAEGSPSP